MEIVAYDGKMYPENHFDKLKILIYVDGESKILDNVEFYDVKQGVIQTLDGILYVPKGTLL